MQREEKKQKVRLAEADRKSATMAVYSPSQLADALKAICKAFSSAKIGIPQVVPIRDESLALGSI